MSLLPGDDFSFSLFFELIIREEMDGKSWFIT